MQYNKQEIAIAKVNGRELADLERAFDLAFAEEMNIDLVHSRLRKVRQFYYPLRLLSKISPWARNLFDLYIIRIKNEFAGFIQLSLIGDKQLHLDFLAICKKFRGQGVGRYVLRRLLHQWVDQNHCAVILEVRLDNPAYRLYQTLGFSAKLQILHYERSFRPDEYPKLSLEPSVKLRKLQDTDRFQLQSLYAKTLPGNLQGILEHDRCSDVPNLFIRQLHWLKNKLMKQKKRAYALHIKDKLIAKVEIKSYEQQNYHVLSILLHPTYELLRFQILKRVITGLSQTYTEGKISTSIYDDLISKQHDLERAGFLKTEAYFFMYRPPRSDTAGHRQWIAISASHLKKYGRQKLKFERHEKCKKI